MQQILSFLPACLWGFFACLAFGLVFNIHGWGILICGFGGALGWFVYQAVQHMAHNDIIAAFLSAVVIAVYSELMARIRRCPVTGYLQIALLPLVPGAGIYYAMRYCVAGENEMFLSTLLHTFGFAAALAVGAMLASTIMRSLLPRFYHRH